MNQFSSPACSLHEFEQDVLTVYHNPNCSKSRATLELARASGRPVEVIEYLKSPPSAAELARIIALLGIAPRELVRRGEPVFRDRLAGRDLSDAQWIEAMLAHPILIERPIVVSSRGAIIGRPPENIGKLLG